MPFNTKFKLRPGMRLGWFTAKNFFSLKRHNFLVAVANAILNTPGLKISDNNALLDLPESSDASAATAASLHEFQIYESQQPDEFGQCFIKVNEGVTIVRQIPDNAAHLVSNHLPGQAVGHDGVGTEFIIPPDGEIYFVWITLSSTPDISFALRVGKTPATASPTPDEWDWHDHTGASFPEPANDSFHIVIGSVQNIDGVLTIKQTVNLRQTLAVVNYPLKDNVLETAGTNYEVIPGLPLFSITWDPTAVYKPRQSIVYGLTANGFPHEGLFLYFGNGVTTYHAVAGGNPGDQWIPFYKP